MKSNISKNYIRPDHDINGSYDGGMYKFNYFTDEAKELILKAISTDAQPPERKNLKRNFVFAIFSDSSVERHRIGGESKRYSLSVNKLRARQEKAAAMGNLCSCGDPDCTGCEDEDCN